MEEESKLDQHRKLPVLVVGYIRPNFKENSNEFYHMTAGISDIVANYSRWITFWCREMHTGGNDPYLPLFKKNQQSFDTVTTKYDCLVLKTNNSVTIKIFNGLKGTLTKTVHLPEFRILSQGVSTWRGFVICSGKNDLFISLDTIFTGGLIGRTPAPADFPRIVDIRTGRSFCILLGDNGCVYFMRGFEAPFRLFMYDTALIEKVPLFPNLNIVQIDANYDEAFAKTDTGEFYQFEPKPGKTFPPAKPTKYWLRKMNYSVKDFRVMMSGGLAISMEDELLCWGNITNKLFVRNLQPMQFHFKVQRIWCGWDHAITQAITGQFYGIGCNCSLECTLAKHDENDEFLNISNWRLIQFPWKILDLFLGHHFTALEMTFC